MRCDASSEPGPFNRIDQVVPFRALDRDTVLCIARQELAALGRREGLRERRLRLRFTPALVERLADEGFDPELGARPLQRLVERRVVAALAEFLLARAQVRERELCVDWRDGAVRIDGGLK